MERRDGLAVTQGAGTNGIFNLASSEQHHFDILSGLEPTRDRGQVSRFEYMHQFIREPR